MKILFFIVVAVFIPTSSYAQTEEQIEEWIEKGDIADEQGDYQEAIRFYELAKDGYRKQSRQEEIAYSMLQCSLAGVYASNGNSRKAIEIMYEELEREARQTGTNSKEYAATLLDLATYFSNIYNFSMAIDLGVKALEIYKKEYGVHPNYANALTDVSDYFNYVGNPAKAIELCSEALEILREWYEENEPIIARTLSRLAYCYFYLGDYPKAIDLCTQAVMAYRNSVGEKHSLYIGAVSDLALNYSNLGDFNKAIELCGKAVDLQRSTHGENNSQFSMFLSNLSGMYCLVGDYDKALEIGKKAMIIDKEVSGEKSIAYARSSCNVALIYYALNKPDQAVALGSKAMEIWKEMLGVQHPDYASSLHNLACFYGSIGDNAKALKYYGDNISILRDNTLQQFSNLTASQRNIFWVKKSYEFTDIYPSLTYRSHATTAPDLYDKSALFAKGLLLSTEIEMNRLIQESGDKEAMRMFDELQLNRLQLQKLYETPIAERHVSTDSLALLVDRQEKALVKRSAVYGDFTRKLRTTWQDVQQALQPNEIAIEFLSFNVYGTDSTIVAALTLRKDDKEPKFIPLFEQQQLQAVSDPFYYHCPELTALVWQPLQQELQGVKRIYFSPAGVLHNIGIEYAPGMENYEMYRLSTTREIITQSRTHLGPPEERVSATTHNPSFPKEGSKVTLAAALFGGIDYNASLGGDSPSLGGGQGEVSVALHRSFIDSLDIRGAKVKIQELPGTRTEVEEIKRSFDNKHRPSILHMGAEATETAVKVLSGTKPNILHIATHGFYFTENQTMRSRERIPFFGMADNSPSLGGGQGVVSSEDKALTRSGLLMAGVNVLKDQDLPMEADDGILTAQEISRLDLRGLDLVVLSACKTGNGDINQGEGVFGLQRGFKKAGAQTLVMSLWEVADDATQILMTSFYNNLLAGLSKRSAFREAQQYLRTCNGGIYDHPQFWAAFVLLD